MTEDQTIQTPEGPQSIEDVPEYHEREEEGVDLEADLERLKLENAELVQYINTIEEQSGKSDCTIIFYSTSGTQLKIKISKADGRAVLDDAIGVIGYAKDEYGLRPYPYKENTQPAPPPVAGQPTQQKPPRTTVPFTAQPAKSADKPAQPPAPASPTPPPQTPPLQTPPQQQMNEAGQKEELSIESVKLSVEPKTNERATLKFYEAGHKFPDLYVNNWTHEDLIKLLSGAANFSAEHLRTASDYDMKMRVFYVLSDKLNSKKNPYKDVIRVEAL